MKTLHPYFLLLLVALSTAACRKTNDEISAENVVHLSKDDFEKKFRASEIFESVDFVPLETNDSCLIGKVEKIMVSSDEIIVKSSKSIFVFDRKGKFKRRIYRLGHGPYEYTALHDFSIMNNGNYLLLDTQIKKIIVLDPKGIPLYEQKISFFADAVESLNDTLLVFSGSGFDHRILLWDIFKKTKVKSYLPYDERYSCSISKPLVKYGKEVYYRHEFLSGMYKVTENKIYYKWHIHFGDRTAKQKSLKCFSFMGSSIYMNPPHTATPYSFTETDDCLFFQFTCEELNAGKPYFVFYSKKTGKKVILDYRYEDDLSFYFAPPSALTATPEGGLVDVYISANWLKHLEEKESEIMKSKLKFAYEEFKSRMCNMNAFDNPVIVIYTLKKF